MDTYIPIPTQREKREAFYGPLFKANHLHIHRSFSSTMSTIQSPFYCLLTRVEKRGIINPYFECIQTILIARSVRRKGIMSFSQDKIFYDSIQLKYLQHGFASLKFFWTYFISNEPLHNIRNQLFIKNKYNFVQYNNSK